MSEALNRLLKVLIIAINAQSHSVEATSPPPPAPVRGWRSLVSIWEKADRLPLPTVDYTGSIGYNTSRALADLLGLLVGLYYGTC